MKKLRLKKWVIFLINLVLIGVFVYSVINIAIWYKDNNQNKKQKDHFVNIEEKINKTIDTPEANNLDPQEILKELKKQNNETVAWLKVNGTNINYPVVKTKDNDFYIRHSFDKSYNKAGWIFADFRNNFDGTDKNTIVYGHNRRDGSMFWTLKDTLKSSWWNNKDNLTITFIKEDVIEKYKVFSVYEVEKEDYYITTDFSGDITYTDFLNTIKSRTIHDFKQDVTENDQILTLSTCSNDNRYRTVLHAVKINTQE
jgi:sortase B